MKYLHAIIIAIINVIFGFMFPFGVLMTLSSTSVNLRGILVILITFIGWIIPILMLKRNIKKGKYNVLDLVQINLTVRLILIPLYIIIFIGCILASVTGPFAIGIWAFAFIVDVFILVITNISTIQCNKLMIKSNIFSKSIAILLYICEFFFCIDVVLAFVYLAKVLSIKKLNIL